MRILVAEDDASIASAIGLALQTAGHAADAVADGQHADRALRTGAFDLLVLDLGLPRLDGTQVLRRLREQGTGIPVLVITARDALNDRVRVLDLGADDYLIKPFALSEFDARIRALVRRAANKGAAELRIGKLVLDLAGQRVLSNGRHLDLTRREFGLLAALATRQDKVTSRQQLMEAVCGWEDELTDNGLDIAIYRVRRKLQGCGVTIRTIRGLGYLLEEGAGADD
jgi:two-component system OmpR family response regulator